MTRRILLSALLTSLIVLQNSALVAETVINASRVATDLSRPIFASAPTNDFDRLFIAEQHSGEIKILDLTTGQLLPDPFLDIGRPSRGNEQGLLGLAFDPDYGNNGHLYVNYTDSSGTTKVERYTVSDNPNVASTESVMPILEFNQPQSNHNGGWIGFGPDDYLYIASGDGGASNDSGTGHTSSTGNAQDITDNLLGKMLRLDVTGDAFPEEANRNYSVPATNPFVGTTGDDEIWAYGLRNPWRSSFDRATGDLYIGDVGQGLKEEIDFQPAASTGGENYGWRLREGTIATPGNVGGPAPEGAIGPIHEYNHENSADGGFSVTGGYVYRGPIDELQGDYFFADYVTSQIWSLNYDGQEVTNFQNRTANISADEGSIGNISSFGEDAAGNLYVISLDGDVFRFDSTSEQTAIVERGSLWKYLDDGSDQGDGWRGPEFDDAAWAEGLAELGYGDDPETVVGFGDVASNKHVTTYFRHDFEVSDPSAFDAIKIELIRDDGAAVYLNGVEVLRNNLDADAPFDALATRSVGGNEETTPVSQAVPTNLLVTGVNTLAVEVHQSLRTSSDLRFDLQLNAILGTSGLPGDFDGDQRLDVEDINALNVAIRAGDSDPEFDLDNDGFVNEVDRDVWVQDLRHTWYGDANLDGEFNSSDLTFVFQTGEYEDQVALNSGWQDGDWNGDGDFSSSDLVVAFADGGYEIGPRPAAAAVPEPTTGWLLIVGMLGSMLFAQRSGTRADQGKG